MKSFDDYVRSGREQLAREDQQAEVDRLHKQQAARDRAAQEQTARDAVETARREAEAISAALLRAGIQPEQQATLDNLGDLRRKSWPPQIGMGGYIDPERAARRAERKYQRLVARNVFRVWDMHSGWTETQQSEPWDSSSFSCFLSTNGVVYTSSEDPGRTDRDPLEVVDLRLPSIVRPEAIRQGLGYLVALHNLPISL
jgi:hypothetical protein